MYSRRVIYSSTYNWLVKHQIRMSARKQCSITNYPATPMCRSLATPSAKSRTPRRMCSGVDFKSLVASRLTRNKEGDLEELKMQTTATRSGTTPTGSFVGAVPQPSTFQRLSRTRAPHKSYSSTRCIGPDQWRMARDCLPKEMVAAFKLPVTPKNIRASALSVIQTSRPKPVPALECEPAANKCPSFVANAPEAESDLTKKEWQMFEGLCERVEDLERICRMSPKKRNEEMLMKARLLNKLFGREEKTPRKKREEYRRLRWAMTSRNFNRNSNRFTSTADPEPEGTINLDLKAGEQGGEQGWDGTPEVQDEPDPESVCGIYTDRRQTRKEEGWLPIKTERVDRFVKDPGNRKVITKLIVATKVFQPRGDDIAI